MGQRHWRLFPTLGVVVAAVASIVDGSVNEAAYAYAQDGQKPISGNDSAAGGGNPLTAEFADFVLETLGKWKVPGAAVAVIDGDEVYTEGYGYATLPDVPATPETLWYGASTTKAQVAAVLSALIHSGNYSALSRGWSTPISSIIRDDFVLQDEWATTHVTLDDAVSHRTGMPRHDASFVREIDGRQATPRDIVRNMRNLPMAVEPRTTPYYCNLMYVTLSHVIETLTGRWLGDVLRETLWEPLGMSATKFDLQDALDAPEHMASGYAWDFEEDKYVQAPFMSVREVSGAGSVISNARDYAQWIKSLIHQSGPLSEAVHQDVRSPRVIWGSSPVFGYDVPLYGLGWVRTLYKGHVLYTHSGGIHAYGTEVYWLPEAKYGVIVFGNTAMCHSAEEIVGWKLINDKLGVPEKDRFDHEAKWEKTARDLVWLYENAVDVLYPERPDPVLPSTLALSELVGTYYNPGYGNITLHEEPHPEKAGEKILVANRPETTWKYSMHFHHVTGDHWIVYIPSAVFSGYNIKFQEFVAGEFKVGADGKASGVEIVWESRMDAMFEGNIFFNRVV